MSCSQFDPDLPHDSTLEKAAWVVSFLNKVNDACGNTTCDSLCTNVNTQVEIEACGNCIANDSSGILNCDKIPSACKSCLADAKTPDDIFECVEDKSGGLSAGAIAGIVVGSIVGVALIVFLLVWYFKYYRHGKPMFKKTPASVDDSSEYDDKLHGTYSSSHHFHHTSLS